MDLRRVALNSQSEEELRDGTRALLRDLVADYGDLPAGLSAEQAIQLVLNEVIGLLAYPIVYGKQ